MTCPNKLNGNCTLHNIYCQYPNCERDELPTPSMAFVEPDIDYNPPTVLTIDETTDLNKVSQMLEKPKVRRSLIAMKVFKSTDEFVNWQSEEPREIFEVTPQALAIGERISYTIFVTYNGGVIE